MRILVHCTEGLTFPMLSDDSIDEIVSKFLGKIFSYINDSGELHVISRSIEFLDPVRIPWGKGVRIVTRIHSLSDKYMARNQIHSRIRVDFTIYYPFTGARIPSSCAYVPGMFSLEQGSSVCAEPSTVI